MNLKFTFQKMKELCKCCAGFVPDCLYIVKSVSLSAADLLHPY